MCFCPFSYMKGQNLSRYSEAQNIKKTKRNPQMFLAHKKYLTTFYFIVFYCSSLNPSGETLLNSCFMVI